MDVVTLAVAKKYTDDSLDGVGALKGVPCQIQSVTDITGGKRVTFLWVDNEETEHTSTMDVMDGAKGDKGDKGDTGSAGADGLGIKSMTINASNHLIVTYDDDTTQDAGLVSGVSDYDDLTDKPQIAGVTLAGNKSLADLGIAPASSLLDKADLVDGKIPANQLPSYVDQINEGYLYEGEFYEDAQHTEQYAHETDKIYIDLTSNKTYRWSGSAYVEISESLALGETSSTAYRGDRGKIAYDDSQTNKASIGTLSNLTTVNKSSLVAAINEVAAGGGGGGGTHYSTTEQVIGTWIDGKPLYQKTFSGTFGSTRDNAFYRGTATHNIASIDKVVDIKASAYSGNMSDDYRGYYPVGLVTGSDSGTGTSIGAWCNATKVQVMTNSSNYANQAFYVTIQYTKTTD